MTDDVAYYIDNLTVPVEVTRPADDDQSGEVASARELWTGCPYCRRPRHEDRCQP